MMHPTEAPPGQRFSEAGGAASFHWERGGGGDACGSPSRPHRILHVDDDSADHLLLRKQLRKFEQSRFDIVFIDSFSEALEHLQREPYDIALVDYQLGDATGLELIEALGGRLCSTPLVILTGRGGHCIDVEATKAGAFDYLDKNDLTPALLERTIRYVRVQFETEHQLRESERLLQQAKYDAEAANNSKSEFLARMSHDLRTPLNAILGFSEVVRDQLFGPVGCEKYVGYAGDIHQSGELLLAMVNDVLDLSKIESGTLELREDELDLEKVVSSALKLAGPSAALAGLSLRTRLEPGLPILCADRQAVDRILFNLLSNSIKFTPRGGQIDVVAKSSDQGLQLVVEDNGIGISPGDMDLVLEPFGQAARPREPSAGSGLGLAIVQSLIELHGGTLVLESVSGSGTRAVVTFPHERLLSGHPAH